MRVTLDCWVWASPNTPIHSSSHMGMYTHRPRRLNLILLSTILVLLQYCVVAYYVAIIYGCRWGHYVVCAGLPHAVHEVWCGSRHGTTPVHDLGLPNEPQLATLSPSFLLLKGNNDGQLLPCPRAHIACVPMCWHITTQHFASAANSASYSDGEDLFGMHRFRVWYSMEKIE